MNKYFGEYPCVIKNSSRPFRLSSMKINEIKLVKMIENIMGERGNVVRVSDVALWMV